MKAKEIVDKSKYSKKELKELREFAEDVASYIYYEYEDDFNDGKLDEDEFSEDEMYDYIVDWGETNNMSANEVMYEFEWRELKDELGLR